MPAWPAFRETNAQLERFAKKYEIGILSNIDDKLLGATRRHLRTDFDLVVTAQQVRSYKPDPAHFKECARRIEGLKKNWVHIASGYPPTSSPAPAEDPGDLGQPARKSSSPAKKKPDAEVRTFRDAASCSSRLTAEACERSRSADALVVTSAFWQVNAVALRAGGEAVLIDSPYLPDELDAPAAGRRRLRARRPARDPRRLRPSARTALLPRPDARHGRAVGGALRREPGQPSASCATTTPSSTSSVPRRWPSARCRVSPCPAGSTSEWWGAIELELHPAEGHTPDGMALFARSLGVLVIGDYLSAVEIPGSPRGSLADYRATLAGWARLSKRPRWWCRVTARITGEDERCGCSTRTWTISTRSSAAMSAPRCRGAEHEGAT